MNEKIISLAKEGNENAFYQLYEKHHAMIYRLAYRYTKTHEIAEDIMQETFIKAFKGISKYNNKYNASFSAWLSRICINCSISHLRKQKKLKVNSIIPLSEMIIEPESQNSSPELSTHFEQMLKLVKKAIRKLSTKQRIILDLRYGQHKNIREIAEIINCSEGNIKAQLFRSKSKLRKQLTPIWEEL